MYNMPTYDVNNFSVGGGILFLGPTGATPTIEVGATQAGAVLTINRTKERVTAGNPMHLIDTIATEETVTFAITGIEWNISNISRALGAGITSQTGTSENLELGGENSFDKLALLFRHTTKAGHTIFIKLWQVSGSGSLALTFGNAVHEFPYEFEAHDSTTDWAGNSLDQDRRLVEIERQKQ